MLCADITAIFHTNKDLVQIISFAKGPTKITERNGV